MKLMCFVSVLLFSVGIHVPAAISQTDILFDLTVSPGFPDAIYAGRTTEVEVHAYDSFGNNLQGVYPYFEASGANWSFHGGGSTDESGRVSVTIWASCQEPFQDILLTTYPYYVGPDAAVSLTIATLGSDEPFLVAPDHEVLVARGEPLIINCRFEDSCGDPGTTTISVEHTYGTSSVEWPIAGSFRVLIDTSDTPGAGYQELVTIRTAGGQSAEVEVRVLAVDSFSSWMYLSTVPDRYESGMYEGRWDSGVKTIYLMVETLDWGSADNYAGCEFSVDYTSALFHLSNISPQAPSPIFFGNCFETPGHCTYQMGAGGPVPNNPWTAITLDFLNFGAGDNLYLLLGPSDTAHPGSMGGPAWAYYNPLYPVVAPSADAVGTGEDHKPNWRGGLVLLNYNPETISQELLDELEARVQHPGHPLWMQGVGVDSESWGALKAQYQK